MAILGLLSQGEMHGYEIKRTLAERRMDWWADIQTGSIYAGLERLAAESLVTAGRVEQGGGPKRRRYRITAAGRKELTRLLREAWVAPGRAARSVDVAMCFLWQLEADEIADLLDDRLRNLEALALTFSPQWAPDRGDPGITAMVADLFEHDRRVLAAEVGGTRS